MTQPPSAAPPSKPGEDGVATLKVEVALVKKLRRIAAMEDRRLTDLASEAVRRWIAHYETGLKQVIPDRPLSEMYGEDRDVGLPQDYENDE